jgi:hypothetical protein
VKRPGVSVPHGMCKLLSLLLFRYGWLPRILPRFIRGSALNILAILLLVKQSSASNILVTAR